MPSGRWPVHRGLIAMSGSSGQILIAGCPTSGFSNLQGGVIGYPGAPSSEKPLVPQPFPHTKA